MHWKRNFFRRAFSFLFLAYLALLLYIFYRTFYKHDVVSRKRQQEARKYLPRDKKLPKDFEKTILKEPLGNLSKLLHMKETEILNVVREEKHRSHQPVKLNYVDIWSLAGIGDYTWEHILGGRLEVDVDGINKWGEMQFKGGVVLRYHTGPALTLNHIPDETENLMLVLNGRAPERIPLTQTWLDNVRKLPNLKNCALMLIGSEVCDNEWLLPYLIQNGGFIKLTFISYDTTIVDNESIVQWPLGAATYRGFPLVDNTQVDLTQPRQYRCNFLGTIYPESSRTKLMQIIDSHHLRDYCFIKTREQWESEEQTESMNAYIHILQQSDLTLNPVGKNIECYRIYEAVALGSLPIIEDVKTADKCSDEPLQLLKDMGAPFLFVHDWSKLPEIIKNEMKISPEEIVERREMLMQWYERFKGDLKELFEEKLKERFHFS